MEAKRRRTFGQPGRLYIKDVKCHAIDEQIHKRINLRTTTLKPYVIHKLYYNIKNMSNVTNDDNE